MKNSSVHLNAVGLQHRRVKGRDTGADLADAFVAFVGRNDDFADRRGARIAFARPCRRRKADQ